MLPCQLIFYKNLDTQHFFIDGWIPYYRDIF